MIVFGETGYDLHGWVPGEAVAAAPYAFLRGCLHSDGCFFINRTGRYRYLSADFTNRSDDIRALFRGAL